eukprot:1139822-Pelagomonas_calceolata.AAC.1
MKCLHGGLRRQHDAVQAREKDPRLPEYAEDDEDTAKGIARLFAEVGEAYINLIATAVQEVGVVPTGPILNE